MALTFISSLLLLIEMTLTKLLELFSNTGMPGWNVQYILCQWADAVKNIPLMLKKWRNSVWKEDGDSLPDSTLAYSEMPGELDKNLKTIPRGIQSEEQLEKIRKII
jgi:hypothetical protein